MQLIENNKEEDGKKRSLRMFLYNINGSCVVLVRTSFAFVFHIKSNPYFQTDEQTELEVLII
jgi:hypothetical protein